ncbi:MAG TPA: SRPBCC domain-containing protein [Sphingobacteriaceae bacterium]|nr:SRPBCC domain-containing protein [Sphingobacteriaceae bacterium]
MNHDLIVLKSVIIHAEPSKIWSALTDPQIIKEYLFGTETITNWEVGSEIIFQGEYEGHKYRDHGVIIENIPNKKISYSYWSGFSGLEDKPENYSTVTYLLTDAGENQTDLNWTQKGYANTEGHKHSEAGMDEFLGSIKNIIER